MPVGCPYLRGKDAWKKAFAQSPQNPVLKHVGDCKDLQSLLCLTMIQSAPGLTAQMEHMLCYWNYRDHRALRSGVYMEAGCS